MNFERNKGQLITRLVVAFTAFVFGIEIQKIIVTIKIVSILIWLPQNHNIYEIVHKSIDDFIILIFGEYFGIINIKPTTKGRLKTVTDFKNKSLGFRGRYV